MLWQRWIVEPARDPYLTQLELTGTSKEKARSTTCLSAASDALERGGRDKSFQRELC